MNASRALTIVLVGLSVLIAGCSMGRQSISDAEQRFREHEERYQAVVDSLLAGETVETSSEGLYQGIEDWSGADDARVVSLTLESYGLAISGRRIGVVFYETGSPPDDGPGGGQRSFETCDAAVRWFQAEHHSLQVAYCRIADRWWAYQISN